MNESVFRKKRDKEETFGLFLPELQRIVPNPCARSAYLIHLKDICVAKIMLILAHKILVTANSPLPIMHCSTNIKIWKVDEAGRVEEQILQLYQITWPLMQLYLSLSHQWLKLSILLINTWSARQKRELVPESMALPGTTHCVTQRYRT